MGIIIKTNLFPESLDDVENVNQKDDSELDEYDRKSDGIFISKRGLITAVVSFVGGAIFGFLINN